MKINAKMHYGLKTMIELAMNAGETGMLQKELAVNQCMPNKFLDSVIHALKVTGLIVNVGGRKSGYKLARPAAEISVYDVYRARYIFASRVMKPAREHKVVLPVFFFTSSTRKWKLL